MTKETLQQLYAKHVGKVADKWSIYLTEYERILSGYRDKPVNLLEIGIQNGGSLEIWAEYFKDARKFVGCDINPDCARLSYEDPRISLVIGDANADSILAVISKMTSAFDVVIDDGSHRSSDIVKSFAKYFPLVADGGVYVAEDLHCSYWPEFEGGLFDPFSSIAFFKCLADIVSYEHWGIGKSASYILSDFFSRYGFGVDSESLSHVHSVEFINSMCVIRKAKPDLNRLGKRIVAGSVQMVDQAVLALKDTSSAAMRPMLSESNDTGKERFIPSEAQLPIHIKELADPHQQIQALMALLAIRDREIQEIQSGATWRLTQLLWRQRLLLAPHGSWRERILRQVRGGLRIWRSRRFNVLLHEVYLKLDPFPPPPPYKEAAKGHETAVVVHIYYPDLWEELSNYLSNLNGDFDLYVSLPYQSQISEKTLRQSFPVVNIYRCENRGRDMAPFLATYRSIYPLGYKYICKIHTKKSTHLADGATWRQDMLAKLLGSNHLISKVREAFDTQADLGMIAPKDHVVPHTFHWALNEQKVMDLARRAGLPSDDLAFTFSAGSMFWFRPEVFHLLTPLDINFWEFEKETGQVDGTLSHALERFLGLIVGASGYTKAEIDLDGSVIPAPNSLQRGKHENVAESNTYREKEQNPAQLAERDRPIQLHSSQVDVEGRSVQVHKDQLTQKDNEIAALRDYAAELERHTAGLEKSLGEIRGSFSFRFINRWRAFLNILMPQGSRRRSAFDFFLKGLRVWSEGGMAGFWAESRRWLKRGGAGRQLTERDLAKLGQVVHDPGNAVLLVSHSASALGASRLALNIVRWLQEDFGKEVFTLLLDGGPLENDFRRCGQVFKVSLRDDSSPREFTLAENLILKLREQGLEYCIANTILSGSLLPIFKKHGIHVITLVHELPTSINMLNASQSANNIKRLSDAIIFPAEYVRRQFLDEYGPREENIVIRPQGVYTPQASGMTKEDARRRIRQQIKIPENAVIFLGCAYGDMRKGFDIFVDSARRLLAGNVPFDAHFVWIGEVESQLEMWTKYDMKMTDMLDKLHILGFVPDPLSAFLGSDVFLLTSREDPFPSVVPMAMDANIPVIAFDKAGGIPGLLADGRGIVVPYLDVDALVKAAVGLILNEHERDAIVRKAKATVDKELNFHDYVQSLLDMLYDPKVLREGVA